MGTPPSILVIKPSAIGDVAQTIPVVRAMSRLAGVSGESPRIGWLVNSGIAGLLVGLPFLARIHHFRRGEVRGLFGMVRGRQHLAALVRELRDESYAIAVDFQGLLRSASLAKMSRASERWGFSNARELAPVFYNRKYTPPDRVHAIDRYIGLTAAMLSIPPATVESEVLADTGLGTTDAELSSIQALISSAGYRGDVAPVVLCPGARWDSKKWPAPNFAALATALHKSTHQPCLLAGAANEISLCDSIVAGADPGAAISLAGKTDLRQMAALLKSARLVVSNDSGPMHMASLQGTPLVALFGPSDPVLTGPWRRLSDVIRSKTAPDSPRAYRHVSSDVVMRDIPVEEVVAASLARLAS